MSTRGLLYLISAALCFSAMSVAVKLAGERLPSQMMVLARALVTCVLSWLWLRRAGLSPRGNHRPLLVVRSLFGFSALACFFFAVTRLPLTEVTVIHYLNPVFVAVIAAFVLKERAGAPLVAAVVISLAGVALVARPAVFFGDVGDLDAMGVAAAFGGAVLSAGAYTTVRKLRETDDPLVIVFWFAAIAVPLSALLVAPVFVMPRGAEWLLLGAVGVSTQLAQVFFTRGLALVRAGPATTIGYVQIVFATTWGLLFFDEVPTLLTLAGTLLIFAGTVVLVVGERRAAQA
jgi:drug/metabolite transporter (DMT)-like permease